MRKFLKGVLIPGSLIMVLASCNSLRHQGYVRNDISGHALTSVFSGDFDKSLYRAGITFRDHEFTGLAVIKYISGSNSFRLAFLSESGMRLFEMEFQHGQDPRVHYITDFLNRKAVVKKISSDFSLLFYDTTAKTREYSGAGNPGKYVLKVKEGRTRNYYFEGDVYGPVKIAEKGCLYGRTTVFPGNYEDGAPRKIIWEHKMMNFIIELKEINYSQWD